MHTYVRCAAKKIRKHLKIADKTGVGAEQSLLIYELEGRALSALIMREMESRAGEWGDKVAPM